MDRQKSSILVLALILVSLAGWWFFSGHGLITVNVKDVPLAKVIRSIERQGHVKIVTNLPGDRKISLRIIRAPLGEAMDFVAARTNAQWHWAWFLAPHAKEISAALSRIPSGPVSGWQSFLERRGAGFIEEIAPDPRNFAWRPEMPAEGTLFSLLDQAAQKTGILFAVPENWNPPVSSIPGPGLVRKTIPKIARQVHGSSDSVILLTQTRSFDRSSQTPRPESSPQTEGSQERRPWMGGGGSPLFTASTPRPHSQPNEEWAKERLEEQIKNLPPEEKSAVQQDINDMRKFWDEVRALPADQRRAKIREMMDNPDVQDRMENRMMLRESRRSPEQRLQRYSRYVERKKQIKGDN